MTSQEIRQNFLDFFQSKDHLIVPSAPIVLKDDPTLMFNNSGMAQFKEYFLGNAKPKHPRIADTQKCLRVSGKHNDLEDVGFDTYHHTMFEMLGNWSFGDYFKKEALAWAWEFLTEVLKLDKNRLYVSVFEGNADENVPFDQEAFDIWKQYVPEDRIILGNKKDNFWEMGDQGPCGPCSEIHIDLRSDEEREKVSGRDLVNADHPQVVEIWNNVFMEFNRKADGSLEKLPAQHVDTGMGFERLCMAMQGVISNYDTDVFIPLIKKLENLSGIIYVKTGHALSQLKGHALSQHKGHALSQLKGHALSQLKGHDLSQFKGDAMSNDYEKTNIAIRVIVDHVRAVAFAIADGQLPSNTGAGYVIRRILRRAIRYGFTFLNLKEPFIYQLVEVLADQMGAFFPEIKSQQQLVTNVIKEEEASFLRTLDRGLVLLEDIISKADGKNISGFKAFELYDTFGFPKDLTALILKEKGLTFDENEFDEAMKRQKDASRAASEVATDDWQIIMPDYQESFVGYDLTKNEVKITRIRQVNSKKDGVLYQLVLTETPFYPEGGGQVGDKGSLTSLPNPSQGGALKVEVIEVFDTKKENNLILHFTKKLPADLSQTFVATVDKSLRTSSAKNHTATHLLHQALRTILGTHVEQKGSLVNPDYLRFDFSHFSKVTSAELKQIEDMVNANIQANWPLIERRNIPFQQALDEGAMALFGEKYGDQVRAIKFGESMELCGGIHVQNAADIWHFKIISEGAVAAGIRRVEAITGEAVKQYFSTQDHQLHEIKEILKNPQDIIKALTQLQEDNIKLKKQTEQLLKEKALQLKDNLLKAFQEVNGILFMAKQVDLEPNGAKDLAYALGEGKDNCFILFATSHEDKPMLTCYISKALVESRGLNASTVVRELGKHIQGGGGGQPFFATAGGKNVSGIKAALEHAGTLIV